MHTFMSVSINPLSFSTIIHRAIHYSLGAIDAQYYVEDAKMLRQDMKRLEKSSVLTALMMFSENAPDDNTQSQCRDAHEWHCKAMELS